MIDMQLADNPITKILNKKLKLKNFENLSELVNKRDRLKNFQFNFEDLIVDITRQSLDEDVRNDLIELAKFANIKEKIQDLMNSSKINYSENRSVDHFQLRQKERFNSSEWQKLSTFSNKVLNNKQFNYVVNIGIGGSDLGPLMINEALKDFHIGPKIYYVSNVDPVNIKDVLTECNPLNTLFIITSKSFSTLETLENALIAKKWLLNAGKSMNEAMVAITSSTKKATEWGFEEFNIFSLSENVGGRYSLWSSVGMPILLSIGEKNFREFLSGAHSMDDHFFNENIEKNIPIILALLRIWNRNFLNRNSHCIVPYSHRLKILPAWAQQLEMESNGKSVDINNKKLTMPASPIIWGETGTNAQHSFFQFIHQGLDIVPLDILLPRNPSSYINFEKINQNHKLLVINAIAQAETLAMGSYNKNDLNKNFSGGRPSTIISWEYNTPYSIGRLIALYENITIASGFIWNINSFDQWGVELGKNLASKIINHNQNTPLSPSAKDFLSKYNGK